MLSRVGSFQGELARRVAEAFDPVLVMLETLGAELNRDASPFM